MAEATRTRITAAEYAELPETTEPMALLGGAILRFHSPKDPHQRMLGKLLIMLTEMNTGGQVVLSPMDVYLDEYNVIQPDLFWVSGPPSLCRLGDDGWWHGAPDLAIEVLAVETTLFDKRDKFSLYERHGTRELWMFDMPGRLVEVWIPVDGKFTQPNIYGADESFKSPVLGDTTIDLKQLFAER